MLLPDRQNAALKCSGDLAEGAGAMIIIEEYDRRSRMGQTTPPQSCRAGGGLHCIVIVEAAPALTIPNIYVAANNAGEARGRTTATARRRARATVMIDAGFAGTSDCRFANRCMDFANRHSRSGM